MSTSGSQEPTILSIIMPTYSRSRIQGQNSVYKEFLEIVGTGSPTGSVLKETFAVSDTIPINVRK